MFLAMSYILDILPLIDIVIYGSVEYVFWKKSMSLHVNWVECTTNGITPNILQNTNSWNVESSAIFIINMWAAGRNSGHKHA